MEKMLRKRPASTGEQARRTAPPTRRPASAERTAPARTATRQALPSQRTQVTRRTRKRRGVPAIFDFVRRMPRAVPVMAIALCFVAAGIMGIRAFMGSMAPVAPVAGGTGRHVATMSTASSKTATALASEDVGIAGLDPTAELEESSTPDTSAANNGYGGVENMGHWMSVNPDVKAWLKVPGTNIDYPVVWANDINYYLHKGYDKSYSYNGVVWTNPETVFGDASQISANTVLYGHNWTNYSGTPRIASPNDVMFGQLTSFHYLSFAQQHPVVYYTTAQGETMTFKIFATFYTEVAFDYINAAGGQYIIDGALARSRHNYNVDVSSSDKLLTLSTCTRAYGATNQQRFVVMARLLRSGESASNGSITDNPGHQTPRL